MATEQTQEMEKIIRKYFQCWLDKDIDPIKDIFSKNITYSECYGPIYTGLEQVITKGNGFAVEHKASDAF